jgi:hypothetical protein
MPAPQTVSFVADSLLLYYRFDESSGTSAADATGTYPATVSAPDWRPGEGQVDGALYFDGTGSTYIEQTGAVVDALNGLEGITVSVWVRSEVTSTDKGIFTSINPNGQGEHLNLRYDKSGFFTGRDNVIQAGVNTDDPAGGTAGESSASAQVTGWQHLAMTWESGGVLRLFIDGVEDTGFSPQGVRNGTLTGITRLLIGKGPKANDPGVDGWSGWIDEFRIYSDPLRPEQIAAIHTEATQMTYTLQLDASGGGTVTRSPALSSYPGGTSVSLSAVADTGYLFSGWSGDLSGTANPASLVMDADKAVTAAFAPDLNSFEGRMIDLGKPVDPALDDDNDGAEALLEYALNRDLTRADPGNNPQTGMENGRMTLSFERVPARDDVTITVERAPALPAGAEDWTAIARSENGGPMVNLGAHEVREFGSELVSVTIVLDNEPDEGFVRIRVTRENP